MPRFNVCYNDKWACYSSIVDDFITDFMDAEEYEAWRNFEYGNANIPLCEANQMSVEEAVFGLCLNNNAEYVRKTAECLGIDKEIVETAIRRSDRNV